MFDQGRRTDTFEQIIELYKGMGETYPELATITFGKVSEFTPLQAADYLATETYWYSQKWLKLKDRASARAHFLDYMKNSMGGEGHFLDHAMIEQNLSRTQLLTTRPDGRGFIQHRPVPAKREVWLDGGTGHSGTV